MEEYQSFIKTWFPNNNSLLLIEDIFFYYKKNTYSLFRFSGQTLSFFQFKKKEKINFIKINGCRGKLCKKYAFLGILFEKRGEERERERERNEHKKNIKHIKESI